MDLIKFGVDVVGGLIGGTTNVVGLVVGSALGAMGVAPEVANLGTNVANSIIAPTQAGQNSSIVGGAVGIALTVYGAIKVILWTLFKFCPEQFLLHWLDWLAFRVARRAKNEVIKRVKEKDAQLYIKAFAEKALDTVNNAIKKGIN